MRLHREVTAPKPADKTWIKAHSCPFEILFGLRQFESAVAGDQIGEFREYFGVLTDDVADDHRLDRDSLRPASAHGAHTVKCLPEQGFFVRCGFRHLDKLPIRYR